MANPRPFTVDPVLTAIAIGYTNPDVALIANQVLPGLPTAAKFQYDQYGLEDFSVPDGKVGRRGVAPRVEFSAEKKTSAVDDYAWESSIPQTDVSDAADQRTANASAYDPRARAASGLRAISMAAREQRVANIVHNPDTYAAGRQVQLSGTDQLSDYEHSDPVDVINTAINGLFVYKANALVMSGYGWQKLRSHPRLIRSVKGGISGDGMISRQQFTELFELRYLLIGEGQVNASAPGQTFSASQLWGKHIAALYLNREGGPGGTVPTFGFTAECGGPVAMTYFDERVGLYGAEVIKVGERTAEHVCAKDLGYLIEDAFA